MIARRSPIFVIPSSFDAEALLPRSLARFGDDARYFASLIVRKAARRQADRHGYVALRAEYLRNVMSFRRSRDVIQSLLAAEVVHRTPYQVGCRSFAYRLDDRYRGVSHVRRPVQDARLLRRLARLRTIAKQRARERLLPVHRALAKQQRRLEIDGTLAREVIARLPVKSNPFDVQGVLVADIEERRFRLSVGRYGRVANSITNMKREVRSALRYGGEPLAGVDIACAQPSLLALLMQTLTCRKDGKNVTSYNACAGPGPPLLLPPGFLPRLPVAPCLGRSVSKFADVCRNGGLFDVLGGLLRKAGSSFSRAEIKKRFLADVLAKRKANQKGAEYPSPVEDAFRGEFPDVWQFIRTVNRSGWEHWRLIRILQQLESWLVIEQVCQRFVTRHPSEFIITLHDAVYVRPAAVERVVEVFDDVFADLDFRMTLKHE